MAMIERKCSFEYSEEEKGNWVKKSGKGTCISEPFTKTMNGNTYMAVLVEQDDGKVHEVFPNSIKFDKK